MSYVYNEYQLKWLEAMKNGNYKQTEGKLLDDEGYDCLGVACVANGVSDDLLYGVQTLDMVDGVEDKLQLRSVTGSFDKVEGIDGHVVSSLVSLNDELYYSFQQIAEYIESNPENVFLPQDNLLIESE